jgi:hypothetical protein
MPLALGMIFIITSHLIRAMTRLLLTARPEAFNLVYQPASELGEIVLIE